MTVPGSGVLEVEGKLAELREGHAVFVPAGAGDVRLCRPGPPAPGACSAARRRLIVVGSRGVGAVAAAVRDSVSNAIVHGADRPVLVVRPRAAAGRRTA